MAIDYTLNWTDDILKPPFTLTGGTVDSTTTSLSLTGKGYVNWGERLQENLLHLLENFAASTPPANPTLGQLWFDNSTSLLKIYHDTAWNTVGGQGRIDGYDRPPYPAPYFPGNLWFNTNLNQMFVCDDYLNWIPLAEGTIVGPTPTPLPTPTPWPSGVSPTPTPTYTNNQNQLATSVAS